MFHSFLTKQGGSENIPDNNSTRMRKGKRKPLKKFSSEIQPFSISIPPKQKDNSEEEDISDDIDTDFCISYKCENENVEEEEIQFHSADIKIGVPSNPQDVTEYELVLHNEMRKRETIYPTKIVNQNLTFKQKGLALSYICRIHYKSQLTSNALFTAYGIFDRILRITTVTEEDMNTFGVAALLIASKMEDVKVLKADIAIACTHNAITKDDLLKKEMQIACILNFDFTFPTVLFFLNYYLRISSMTQEKLLFARYVCEMCLAVEEFDGIKPSALAATAVVITRLVYQSSEEAWPQILESFTQYSLADLERHIMDAYEILVNEREENDFIRIKYEQKLYSRVASKEIPDPSPIF